MRALAPAELIQAREVTRHRLRWEVTQEAGATAVLPWAVTPAAVHVDFPVAVAALAAVDTAVVVVAGNQISSTGYPAIHFNATCRDWPEYAGAGWGKAGLRLGPG